MRVSRIACVAAGAAAAVSLAFCLPTMSFADDAPQTGPSELTIEDAEQGDQENPVTEGSPEQPSLEEPGASAGDELSDEGQHSDLSDELPVAESLPVLTYAAHCQDIGWQGAITYDLSAPDAKVYAGTTGRSLRMESMNLSVQWEGHEGGIQARSHVQNLGWLSWSDGATGTTGRGLRMEAVEFRLTGELAENYSIWYRAHCANVGWLDWACDGAAVGTAGKGYAIEAVQIVLVPREGGQAPGATDRPFIGNAISLSGSGVYFDGSSKASSRDGVRTLGSADSSNQLVSISVGLNDKLTDGSVSYCAYQSFGGWQDEWASEGTQLAATNGGNAIQAVRMQLSGDLAGQYDIWYRVQLADAAWTGWASNGDAAGLAGSGALKAVQVALTAKGADAPGTTDGAYTEASFDVPTLVYQAHCASLGWQNAVGDGVQAGTTGKSLALEALRVQVLGTGTSSVQISAHIANVGWQDYAEGASYAGTVGKSTAIQAVKLRLNGDMASDYDIYYRVHASNVGWLGWAKNDEEAGTTGFGNAVEAIEIKLVKHGDEAPSQSVPALLRASLTAKAHVQDYGWMDEVSGNSVVFGTTGQAKRMEAFTLALDSTVSGGISYSAHVSDIGWQSAVADGTIAGTVGKGKQIECVKLNLTGDASKYYDIWYRAYVQDYGWLGWTSNGSMAGTSGIGFRVETLQVMVKLKGTGAPGSTDRAYTDEPPLPADQSEMLRRANGYSSNTSWIIMVDNSTCRAGVFRGSQGNWSLVKYYTVSPGASSTPTVRGQFTVGSRGYSFGSGYTCYYWTQFYGAYLFHSVLYYQNTFRIMDGRLGQNLSHGCVRMDINEAKWIYENIPSGTKVVSY